MIVDSGFALQILLGMLVTLELAVAALILGLFIGLTGALIESIPNIFLRYLFGSIIFLIRGLPELLVLFFIYFGLTSILSQLFHQYIDISPFTAGVVALGFIFGAYASAVFKGAFNAIDPGQIESSKVIGLTSWQTFKHIQLPQAWHYALPGLGNLWLVLIKDTAIVSLIGLGDMMNQAKVAASTTHQPFTYYLIAAFMYLLITSVSQKLLQLLTIRANRFVHL